MILKSLHKEKEIRERYKNVVEQLQRSFI